MGITSLQVCVDSSSDWFKGTIWEEGTGMASSPITTPPGEDNILACTRPLIERRLRPQHDQALKCPRCESTHTKFCYYNNYSLSQPRYFCKTCRRYWTKGGTLRNIPVGGGCRKNKKVSSANSKKPSSASSTPDCHTPPSSSLIQLNQQNNVHARISPPLLSYSTHNNPTDLQLAFPEQLHFSAMFNNAGTNHGFLLENPTPIDFMENKFEALVGSHDFMGSGESSGGINNNGEMMSAHNAANFHDFCFSFGPSSLDHGNSSAAAGAAILESCQRLMLPYDQHHHHQQLDRGSHDIDVKPNAKILPLEWHDHQQACNSDAGYNFGGLGSWTGLMNGYGSSATNPLV